jgi:hypothetical protein
LVLPLLSACSNSSSTTSGASTSGGTPGGGKPGGGSYSSGGAAASQAAPTASHSAPTASKAGPAASQGAVVPVGSSGGEVESVKAMLKKMSEQKDLASLAPYFSNRSAAAMGMVMMIPLTMMVAFADMGQQMGQSLGKAIGGDSAKPSPPPAPSKKVQAMKADMDALAKKYDLKGSKPDKEEMKKFESRGREFMTDIGLLFDKMSKSEGGKAKMSGAKPEEFTKKLEDVDFKVVSPTEVKLIQKKKGKDDMPAKAIVEDGAWRLDFGGIEELAKHGKSAPGGGPGPFLGASPTPPGPASSPKH